MLVQDEDGGHGYWVVVSSVVCVHGREPRNPTTLLDGSTAYGPMFDAAAAAAALHACCSPDPDLRRRFFLRLETMQARISMHTGRVARRRRSSIAHRVPLAARHRLPSSRRRLVQARYSGRRRAGTPVISGRRHKSQRAYTVPVTSQLECRRLSSSTTCVLNSAAILNANSSLPFVRTNAKQYKLDQ